MTLRTLYAVMGIITLVSAAGFLVLLTPPDKKAREQMRRRGPGVEWIGRSLFVWGIANVGNGLRYFVVNFQNRTVPPHYAGWFDAVTALSTSILSTLASCFVFAVYLSYRRWENPD